MNDLESFLQNMVTLRSQMPCPESFKWSSFEQLVLKFGEKCEWQPKPKRFRKGTPKMCFKNSGDLAMRNKSLIYVEGYALMRDVGIAIQHAWVVKRGTNTVIDITSDGFSLYIGIPFKTEYLAQRRKMYSDSWSLIDDWSNDFPLLRMEESAIREIVESFG